MVTAERTQKRGGGKIVTASDLKNGTEQEAHALNTVLSREPTPEMAASFAEECDRLLGLLEPDLKQLALGKMEGHSNEDLAAKAGCGLRTIERRLELIRRIWKDALDGTE